MNVFRDDDCILAQFFNIGIDLKEYQEQYVFII